MGERYVEQMRIEAGPRATQLFFKAKANVAQTVRKGAELGSYSVNAPGNFAQRLTASVSGRVAWIHTDAKKDLLEAGPAPDVLVAELMPCLHPIIYQGSCVECEEAGLESQGQLIYGNIAGLRTECEQSSQMHIDALMAARKLVLVLDLDQTLVYARRLEAEEQPEGCPDIFDLRLNCRFALWLRPFLTSFLRRLAERFEIYVYTFGTRDYAVEVLRAINREEVLLDSARLITRNESRKGFKELGNILPALMGPYCLIVDDTAEVWPDQRSILLQIPPFIIGDANAEESFAGDLPFMAMFLGRVHNHFFASSVNAASTKVNSTVGPGRGFEGGV